MSISTHKNVDALAMQREQGPLLEVKNLQVDFTTDSKKAVHAVRDASFSVYPGQWVAIVGESGSGKSTSCLLYTSPSPRDGLLSRMPSSA